MLNASASIVQHAKPVTNPVTAAVKSVPVAAESITYKNWKQKLQEQLSSIFSEQVILREGADVNFKCSNRNLDSYIAFDKYGNRIVISKILSGALFDFLKANPSAFNKPANSNFTLQAGDSKQYDMVYCELKTPLKSEKLNFVFNEDIPLIYQFATEYARSIAIAVKAFKNTQKLR